MCVRRMENNDIYTVLPMAVGFDTAFVATSVCGGIFNSWASGRFCRHTGLLLEDSRILPLAIARASLSPTKSKPFLSIAMRKSVLSFKGGRARSLLGSSQWVSDAEMQGGVCVSLHREELIRGHADSYALTLLVPIYALTSIANVLRGT